MEALGYIRLYNILYAISYGDKVSWHAVEWLAKLYSFSFPLKPQPSYTAGWQTACAASIYCCMHIACAARYLYHVVGSVRKGQDLKD